MVYDDLRIALERKKRIKAAYEQEYEIKWDMIHISERISIMLPEGAAELEEEKSIKRFGRNENKRTVMTIPGDEANFLFQFQRSTVNGPESVQAMCDSLKNMIMRLQPANYFYSDGMEDTDHVDIRWFDFESFALDGKMYNFIFCASVKFLDELLIGSFHCREEKADIWKPIFVDSVYSIKGLEEKDET